MLSSRSESPSHAIRVDSMASRQERKAYYYNTQNYPTTQFAYYQTIIFFLVLAFILILVLIICLVTTTISVFVSPRIPKISINTLSMPFFKISNMDSKSEYDYNITANWTAVWFINIDIVNTDRRKDYNVTFNSIDVMLRQDTYLLLDIPVISTNFTLGIDEQKNVTRNVTIRSNDGELGVRLMKSRNEVIKHLTIEINASVTFPNIHDYHLKLKERSVIVFCDFLVFAYNPTYQSGILRRQLPKTCLGSM